MAQRFSSGPLALVIVQLCAQDIFHMQVPAGATLAAAAAVAMAVGAAEAVQGVTVAAEVRLLPLMKDFTCRGASKHFYLRREALRSYSSCPFQLS